MQIMRGHPEIMTKQEPGCLPGARRLQTSWSGGGGEGGTPGRGDLVTSRHTPQYKHGQAGHCAPTLGDNTAL